MKKKIYIIFLIISVLSFKLSAFKDTTEEEISKYGKIGPGEEFLKENLKYGTTELIKKEVLNELIVGIWMYDHNYSFLSGASL